MDLILIANFVNTHLATISLFSDWFMVTRNISVDLDGQLCNLFDGDKHGLLGTICGKTIADLEPHVIPVIGMVAATAILTIIAFFLTLYEFDERPLLIVHGLNLLVTFSSIVTWAAVDNKELPDDAIQFPFIGWGLQIGVMIVSLVFAGYYGSDVFV